MRSSARSSRPTRSRAGVDVARRPPVQARLQRQVLARGQPAVGEGAVGDEADAPAQRRRRRRRPATPSRSASPAVGRARPATSRRSVDLPEPLAPTSAIVSPGSTRRLDPPQRKALAEALRALAQLHDRRRHRRGGYRFGRALPHVTIALLLTALLAACGGSGDDDPTTDRESVTAPPTSAAETPTAPSRRRRPRARRPRRPRPRRPRQPRQRRSTSTTRRARSRRPTTTSCTLQVEVGADVATADYALTYRYRDALPEDSTEPVDEDVQLERRARHRPRPTWRAGWWTTPT